MATIPDNHYPKYSFDRFGDDLSQLVLTYLSLEDRFRFECVSKQWQRVVYQTQQELVIDIKLIKKLENRNFFSKDNTDWDLLKTLLTNKCPNIMAIDLHRNCIKYKIVYKIMDLLAECVPDLRSFTIHSSDGDSHTEVYGLIDRILVFRELRHLTIDCQRVYGDCNPFANSMDKVANSCRHIRTLVLNVNNSVAESLLKVLNDMKLFPVLDRLHLGFYCRNLNESTKISVKPLLECRRLRYVELDSNNSINFIDVDSLGRQVVQLTITKTGPKWQSPSYYHHLPSLKSLDDLIEKLSFQSS